MTASCATAAHAGRVAARAARPCPSSSGIILVLSLGTVVLVQNTFQQFPIVTKDVVQHEAYRAMVVGPRRVRVRGERQRRLRRLQRQVRQRHGHDHRQLDAHRRVERVQRARPSGRGSRCPGSGAANGPPGWFLVDNPVINTSTGNLSVNIVGAAGYANDYNYQTAVVTLQPLNGFLLNVLWINYDQTDPAVVTQYGGGTCTPACDYYWTPNPNALGNNCQNIDFITR